VPSFDRNSTLNPYLLLLDNFSTVNLIANWSMLTDIQEVTPPLKVQCSAGVKQTNLMATFGNFPESVWFDPNGIANILSLHTVSKYYAVMYDSHCNDIFHVTNANGWTYHFSLLVLDSIHTNVCVAHNGLLLTPWQTTWQNTLL